MAELTDVNRVKPSNPQRDEEFETYRMGAAGIAGGGVRRDGVWAETNSDPMFETYNTNVTLDVTDE